MSSKHPADANNKGAVLKPRNSSQSYARGGGAMAEAEKQHRENSPHDISGGSRATDKRTQPVERDGVNDTQTRAWLKRMGY